MAPSIKAFFWGKSGGTWQWLRAGYTPDGTTDQGFGIPMTIAGANGDPTLASLVSDSIYSTDLRGWATVPIVIINDAMGTGSTLEEFNIEIASHYWAQGLGNGSWGLGGWWNANKAYFATATNGLYQDSGGAQAYDSTVWGNDTNNPEQWTTPNGLPFVEGSRVPLPSNPTLVPSGENALGSTWQQQPSNLYAKSQAGIGFIQSAYGDTVLDGTEQTQYAANSFTSCFGDPRTSNKGWYGTQTYYDYFDLATRNIYRNTGSFTGDECSIERLERKSSYSAGDKNEANIWRFMHVWNNAAKTMTARGFWTIKNIADSKYNIVYTNSDSFQSFRILRGYLYISVSDGSTYLVSGDPKPVVSDFEGSAYGRYFNSIITTGRWYAV